MALLKKISIALLIFVVYMGISYGAISSAIPLVLRHIFATLQFCILTGALIWLVLFAAISTWKHRRLESILLLLLSFLIAVLSVPTYLGMIRYFGSAALQEFRHGKKTTTGQVKTESVTSQAATSEIIDIADKKQLDEFVALSDKPVVIKVSATWCPPCQKLKPVYHEVAHEMHDAIHFGQIDIDSFAEREALSSVESLPTVLYYKDGKEVARTTGFQIIEEIKEEIKKHF